MRRFIAFLMMVGIGLGTLDAATVSKSINIKASVPESSALNVVISRYTGASTTPDQGTYTEINFGELTLDTKWYIFRSQYYYSVDVGVLATTASWTISHVRTSFTDGKGNSLDGNVNVTCVLKKDATETIYWKGSYANSNNIQISKSQIPSGYWVRFYYGIASGASDNTGVTPIPATQPAGAYQGVVTLTLTTA